MFNSKTTMKRKEEETQKRDTFFEETVSYTREYCDHSGVHGVQYFLEKKRTKCERISWVVAFIISIIICFFVIAQTYQTWEENAVGVMISNKKTLIYDIPFPAITICPVSKIPKFNCLTYKNALEYAHFLCDYLEDQYNIEEYDNYIKEKCNYNNDGGDFFNRSEEFYIFMYDVKPTVYIENCQFQKENCLLSDFTSTITRKGVCYSFNLLIEENIFKNDVWRFSFGSRDLVVNGFSSDDDTVFSSSEGTNTFLDFYVDNDLQPKRQLYEGYQYGLQLQILTPQKEIDNCTSSFLGYEVFLHDSLSLPGRNSFKLLLNQTKSVKLKPSIINTTDSIRKYSVSKRKCYFQDEKPLKYFKIYTKENCEVECWTNYSLAYCGCIHFSMPRIDEIPICASSLWNECATIKARELAIGDMIMSEIENGYASIGTKIFLNNRRNFGDQPFLNTSKCRCLPSCSSVEYNTEIYQSDFNDKFLKKILSDVDHQNFSHVSSLNVFFGENEFPSYVRKEVYGPVDFLANFGGLLGLFCGFSVLSLVEILYFLSLRIICNKNIYGQWSGQN